MKLKIRILTKRGVLAAHLDDDERSVVGSHWNAIQHFLRTGELDKLREFDGTVIGGLDLETDPDAIEEWWRRRELDFLEIYAG